MIVAYLQNFFGYFIRSARKLNKFQLVDSCQPRVIATLGPMQIILYALLQSIHVANPQVLQVLEHVRDDAGHHGVDGLLRIEEELPDELAARGGLGQVAIDGLSGRAARSA